MPDKLNRPVRVVMFGSGPRLNEDAREFLARLEAHPEIELLGAFCQAPGQSEWAVFRDLWRRRKLLAFPLLASRWLGASLRFLRHPRRELERKRCFAAVAGRIQYVKKIHAPSVLEQVRALQPDLGLIYGSPILKPALFTIPKLGTLGIHHGMLPEYRGNKTTFWALYNGEPEVGVSIQQINAGLDTGGIIKEGRLPVGRKSYQTLTRELEELGLDLYLQAILEVKDGTAVATPQPTSRGRLYYNPKPGDFLRFWTRQLRRSRAKPDGEERARR